MENCCRLVFYNRELFPILSSACARTIVILAGKCGSRRQSTTSFSEHVVVAKTSYQMLQIFSFSDLERAQPPSMEISVLTLVVKNSTKKISGVSILENRRENVKLNAVLVVVLVFESKALKALLFTLTVLTSISVEISRKVARARKRKINRPTITLFSWSYSYRTWLSTNHRARNRSVIEIFFDLSLQSGESFLTKWKTRPLLHWALRLLLASPRVTRYIREL